MTTYRVWHEGKPEDSLTVEAENYLEALNKAAILFGYRDAHQLAADVAANKTTPLVAEPL